MPPVADSLPGGRVGHNAVGADPENLGDIDGTLPVIRWRLDATGESGFVQIAAEKTGQHRDGENLAVALGSRRRLHYGLIALNRGKYGPAPGPGIGEIKESDPSIFRINNA